MTETVGNPQIQRAHRALIGALERVDAVCRELGVTYWVDGGTLLGTVRHQGPIPWDDDVDLCMLRDDLDLFVKNASTLLGPKYSLQTSSDDSAIAVDAKIYVNGSHISSKFAEAHGLPTTRHDGLYIDILIMDLVSQFRIVRRVDRALSWLVSTRPWARLMAHSPSLTSSKKRVRWMIASYVPWFVVVAARRWLDWRATRDGRLLAVGIAGLWNGWTYPVQTIFPLKEGMFAGLVVPVPADTHAYLIGHYGSDYMTLPPEDQRATHTDKVLFDER